jgi:thiol-disulfide isomerase/thioredoxin
MTTAKHGLWISLALCAALAACSKSPSGDSTAAAPTSDATASLAAAASADGADSKAHVEWFEGGLDAAFAKAKADNKPVMVNWGAHWCPYCMALKATVFTRPDFVAQAASVIAVDVDGDTAEGQVSTEQFHVIGYPTLAVFKPDRTEIARVSGGMDLEQYASTLARAVEDERPVADVLAAAAKPETGTEHVTVSAADCRRLAYNGWELEDEAASPPAELSAQLATVAQRCATVDAVARVRLKARSVASLVSHESDALEEGKAPSAALSAGLHELVPLISKPADVRASADILSLAEDSFYTAVKRQGAGFPEEFRKAWTTAMLGVAHDSHFGASERLLAMATAIDGEKQLRSDGKAPAELEDEARAMVKAALSKDAQKGTRHDIVNAARLVYSGLGDNDALYELLTTEAPKSETAYYYFGTIAKIAEKRGDKDEALGWLKRAYESTTDLAAGARANYGSRYVAGLTRLKPDDLPTIRRVSLEVAQAINERDARREKAPGRADHLTEPLTKWATTAPRKAVVADVEKRLTSA